MRKLSIRVAILSGLYLNCLSVTSSIAVAASPDSASQSAPGLAKTLAAGKMEVLVIEQHGSVSGSQLVYVVPDAVRIDCPKKGVTIISKGPEWKVCSYSLETKKWFETPVPQYITPFKSTLDALGIDLSNYRVRKVGEERIYQRDCSVYKPLAKSATKSDALAEHIQGIWLADDVKAADQVGDLMEREFGLPPMHKPLIKFDYVQDGHTIHALTTTFCHPRLVSSDWFGLPKGLVRGKSHEDVYPVAAHRQFLP